MSINKFFMKRNIVYTGFKYVRCGGRVLITIVRHFVYSFAMSLSARISRIRFSINEYLSF